MIPKTIPQCFACKLYNDLNASCPAFKDIPLEIKMNLHDHRSPFSEDNHILFQPKNQSASEYMDTIFKVESKIKTKV